MPSGLSLEAASELASELRRTVREFPEVRYIMTQLGREDAAVDAWTPSHIEAPIGLTPYDTWPKGETKADFVRKLNERLKQLPGFAVGINQPISDMVFDLVGGAHSALVIRVFGDDLTEDRRIAAEIVEILRNTRGTAEASIFQEPPAAADLDRGRPRGRRALRHQHLRHHQPDPERGRRRGGHAGFRRRPRLRRERALPIELPQRSGGDRQPDADQLQRHANSAVRRSPRSRSATARARSRAPTASAT